MNERNQLSEANGQAWEEVLASLCRLHTWRDARASGQTPPPAKLPGLPS